MKVGSLFSGIGGMDLGLERAGMEVRWQIEKDDWCRRVLDKHWPKVEKYEDIREVDPAGLESVDLICGGFPCQPFSQAGKQRGVHDARWLWPEFARIVRHLRPRWVLAENVPRLRAVNSGRAFGEVVRDLAEIGYRVEWNCIPAAAVGSPHQRDRIWIIGYMADANNGRLSVRSSSHDNDRDHAPGNDSGGRHPNEARILGGPFGRISETLARRLSRFRAVQTIWEEDPAEASDPESRVDRVAHGVSRKVDRLRGLGNAVVPQLIQFIGEQIIRSEGV